MPTPLPDLIPILQRELNAPGAEQFPDFGGGDYLGYLADGFWDVRLATMLNDWTILDGQDLATPQPAGTDYITDQSTKGMPLPQQFQMMIVIFAGARLLRNKILTLAVNFQAKAGSVEYEQQASATTLRAILASLQRRMDEMKLVYSDEWSPGQMYYMDGPLQRATSDLNSYLTFTTR